MASLEDVYESIRSDPRWDHLRGPRIKLVRGRGNEIDPLAFLVGEGPGARENLTGQPFVGRSGKVLAQLMATAGLYAEPQGSREIGWETPANSFITNVVKYRPPGNRTPNLLEIMNGTEALRAEWVAVGRPRLIVAVGAPARNALTPVEYRIQPGNWVAYPDGKTFCYVQFHPAWAMRNGDKAKDLVELHWKDMGQWIRESGMF